MANPIKPDAAGGLAKYEELRQLFLKRTSLPADTRCTLHELMVHAGYDMKKHAVELDLATVLDDLVMIAKEKTTDES
jgi:hypothetical protein